MRKTITSVIFTYFQFFQQVLVLRKESPVMSGTIPFAIPLLIISFIFLPGLTFKMDMGSA